MTTLRFEQHDRSRYAFTVLVLLAAIALEILVQQPAGMRFPGMLYAAIVATAWYAGVGPAMMALGTGLVVAWLLLGNAAPAADADAFETLLIFGVVAGTTAALALAMRQMSSNRSALLQRLARVQQEAADAHGATEALSQRLSEQAHWHAMTLCSVGEAVITVDATDRVLTMNPIAESLTGWRSADVHGAPLERVFVVVGASAPNDASAAARASLSSVHSECGRESLLQAKDGSARFVRFTSTPIARADGHRLGRVVTFADLSAQRQAEAVQRDLARVAQSAEHAARSALLASQAVHERFSAFMAHFPYPAFIQDEQGEFVFLNEAGQASAAWREVATHAPENLATVMSESVALAGNDRHYFSIRFPILADGKTWLGGIAIDMTERVRAERALSERTAEFETLFHNVPAPLWIARDTAAAQVLGNAAANELLGISPNTSDPRAWRFFCGKRPCEPDELPIALCMRERRIVHGTDMELERPDGSRRSVRMTAAPLYDDAGRVRGAVAAAIDITQLKDYEAELEQAVQRRDEFLAVLAHELRNPLVPIRMSTQILARVPGDIERVRRAGATIDRQAGRMVRLIDDLLDVARISQGLVELELLPRPIAAIIDSAIESLGATAQNTSHTIEVAHADPSAQVVVDSLRAEQIVVNVLSNALKYSPPGTTITVRTHADDRFVRIVVVDQGRGIAKEHLSEIFRMFARPGIGENQGISGLGVGLALAKQLAEQQGGSIEAASEGPGRGATFTVAFPRADPCTPGSAAAS